MMQPIVIIFHNEARTDYQVRGPFKTVAEAEQFATSVWDNYTPSAIHAVETHAMIPGDL